MDVARLRETVDRSAFHVILPKEDALALLDALEQAQKERDEASQAATRYVAERDQATARLRFLLNVQDERDAAQQDAKDARALLMEAIGYVTLYADSISGGTLFKRATALRARIEAMLEKKV